MVDTDCYVLYSLTQFKYCSSSTSQYKITKKKNKIFNATLLLLINCVDYFIKWS